MEENARVKRPFLGAGTLSEEFGKVSGSTSKRKRFRRKGPGILGADTELHKRLTGLIQSNRDLHGQGKDDRAGHITYPLNISGSTKESESEARTGSAELFALMGSFSPRKNREFISRLGIGDRSFAKNDQLSGKTHRIQHDLLKSEKSKTSTVSDLAVKRTAIIGSIPAVLRRRLPPTVAPERFYRRMYRSAALPGQSQSKVGQEETDNSDEDDQLNPISKFKPFELLLGAATAVRAETEPETRLATRRVLEFDRAVNMKPNSEVEAPEKE
mmetsp:Transcript_6137/g.10929  ORF Transcript_6137/g.10929 Transcript_6137/m.10929 type:complete len:271 (-) Transcript_6137:139-951(-)|eukprot:CAMPEP_0182447382 /NCGR_PEP_ID=MMETSP1172-20130603/15435_1 /TAXON_ID=708627 /ORGANISM="Timspurckia oligopyrenoides, Strain CCMP3278" /LENGTH=270 /DNA_ID=CAMNT_0024643799 /DNA_START=243 /DNA_END=1055 /DNA_ORIENTATION=+